MFSWFSRMQCLWNFFCRCKKMGFYGRLSHIARNAFRIFEFYYFMKQLHEYIQCTNPIICRFYNFFMPIENVLFDNNRDFEEVQKFFTCHCSKKNNHDILCLMFKWWFSKKKKCVFNSSATKENKRTSTKWNWEAKFKYFISSPLTTDYELKKSWKLFFL